MKNIIISPHTDDAIFSLGDYIIQNTDFWIITPFAGLPPDEEGYKKHTLLRLEHENACNKVNADFINGHMLDDVYGEQDLEEVIQWVKDKIEKAENIYFPLGIKHPDHNLLSNILIELVPYYKKTFYIYAELPYRMNFPEIYKNRLCDIKEILKLKRIQNKTTKEKLMAVKEYNSQIDDDVINKVMVEEEIWIIQN